MKVMKLSRAILCFCFLVSTVLPVEKGSDSIISIEPFFSFPAGDPDNQMLTFGFFRSGFGLQDYTTTCTFKSVFPISGSLNLNGGQLYLANDLMVQDPATFNSAGIILGNYHTMEFSSGITGIPAAYNCVFENTNLFLRSDFLIVGTVKFMGNCLLDGGWNRVTLGIGANIVVGSNATLRLRNIEIDGIVGSNIACLDNGGSIILDNMLWAQDGNYTITNGSMLFSNNVTFIGPWNFNYQTNQTSTIDSDSTWYLSDLTKVTMGRQGSVFGREPLYFTDITSVMKMNNSTLNVSPYGMRMTRGVLLVDGEVGFNINSTNSTNGLAFGNKIQSGDQQIKFAPGAVLNFQKGDLVHDVVAIGNFVSGDVQKIFMRHGPGTNYWSNFDSYFVNVNLEFNLGGINFLAPGKHGYFNNCLAQIGSSLAFTITATRINDFIFGLYSGGNFSVTVGALPSPLGVIAHGPGNTFSSVADVSASIVLNDGGSQLNLGISGALSLSPVLNGGTVILTKDLLLTQGASLTGTGMLVLGQHNLNFGTTDLVWTSSIKMSAANASINLNSMLSLTSSLVITGNCQISGAGNTLNFSNGGSILVAKNSTLKIIRTRLTGLVGTNIRCFDNSAKIILQDVDWVQSGNFTFTVGGLKMQKVCRLIGESYTFAYQTPMTSTIDALSRLFVDRGVTFSYDPITMQQKGILFTDRTSELMFHNSNLYVTKGGLKLLDGSLIINGNVNFYADLMTFTDGTISTTAGIIWGNNDGINDCFVDVSPGSILAVNNGYLIYRDTLAQSLLLENGPSTIQMNPGSYLNLEQTLYLGNGLLLLSTQAVVQRDPGTAIIGAVSYF